MMIKLMRLYCFYHKLIVCYRWKYRKIYIGLNISSIFLTVAESALTPFTLVTVRPTGCGLIIQGYITNVSVSDKLELCKFAYQSYRKVLI